MPVGMQPGFADQMRQSGQMGGPPGGGMGGPPPMQAGPPMAPPGMGMEAGPDEEIKKLLVAIIQLIMGGAHNGGPPPGAPGMAGQSPGMPM